MKTFYWDSLLYTYVEIVDSKECLSAETTRASSKFSEVISIFQNFKITLDQFKSIFEKSISIENQS